MKRIILSSFLISFVLACNRNNEQKEVNLPEEKIEIIQEKLIDSNINFVKQEQEIINKYGRGFFFILTRVIIHDDIFSRFFQVIYRHLRNRVLFSITNTQQVV